MLYNCYVANAGSHSILIRVVTAESQATLEIKDLLSIIPRAAD